MTKTTLALAALAASATFAQAAGFTVHTFKKLQITDQFWCEGAHCGDFNHDGKTDIVGGPFWWEGPEFKVRHEFRPATKTSKIKKADGTEITIPGYKGALGNENDYSDNFLTYVHDLNGDGWADVIVYGLPGTPCSWFENPKNKKTPEGTEQWAAHKMIDSLDNESPTFGDIVGDARPEIVCNSGGFLGYAAPDWSNPTQPWKWHSISPKGAWHKYTHGIGFGDVNGDGRADLLEQHGWWEQPASLDGDPVWANHKFPFAPGPGTAGGAQIYAYDFNGDGLNDVLTTLNPHGFGLVWYEQVKDAGQISFKQHTITGREPKDSKYGVKFSQPHGIDLADVDGDGIKDFVTGKRFWAHGPKGDDEPNAPAVLYWFKTVRNPDKSADFIPYLIDDNSGVGTQVTVADINGDQLPDVIVGNKKGVFVFTHEARSVSKDEWEKAQPKRFQP
ncbi:MAG: VCBS repeat-containing protein [Verrucomicrobia bacterium]|nr:VCBS repeat-containing protein [Verrucomicrobiota bacterium]